MYQYAGNSPLVMVDLSGLEAMIGASPITDAPIICSECPSQPNPPPRGTWEQLKDTIRDDGLRTIEAMTLGAGGMAARAPLIVGKAPALFEKLSSLGSQMVAKITAPWASVMTKRAENVTNVVSKVNPRDLIPTHGKTMSKGEFRDFLMEVKADGMIKEPISYILHDGKKYVVDGHHRLSAAKMAGFKEVPVIERQLPINGYKTIDDLFDAGF